MESKTDRQVDRWKGKQVGPTRGHKQVNRFGSELSSILPA